MKYVSPLQPSTAAAVVSTQRFVAPHKARVRSMKGVNLFETNRYWLLIGYIFGLYLLQSMIIMVFRIGASLCVYRHIMKQLFLLCDSHLVHPNFVLMLSPGETHPPWSQATTQTGKMKDVEERYENER